MNGAQRFITGGQVVVEGLLANGVDTVYALPGVQLDHLMNALFEAKDRLTVVHARHEQGVAYMALGHAQSTGRPGVYACVPGPGFLNTAAALSTAFAVHAPVLALVAQIDAKAIGVGSGELHELPDQSAIVRQLVRWYGIALTPEDVPGLIETAFVKLAAGIGPVAIELPADILEGRASLSPARPAEPEQRPDADPAQIEEAAGLLGVARAPLIVAGAGAYGAEADLVALAERLGAPVMTHLQGRGLLPSEHPLSIGFAEGRALWDGADLVLAVGTRLQRPDRDWGPSRTRKLIRIDTDPAVFTRGPVAEIAIQADAQRALSRLAEASAIAIGPDHGTTRLSALASLKTEIAERFEAAIPQQMSFLQALRAELPDGACVVADYTQIGYVAADRFPVRRIREILTPGYQGTLGFAYATALGAKVATPHRAVVSLSGDGGFLFTGNELATAVRHSIAAVAIVFVDGAFGNVQRMQREIHGGKVIATDLLNPDFVAFAESFGAKARRVADVEAFAQALRWALDEKGPTLIEVAVPRFPSPWHLIEP